MSQTGLAQFDMIESRGEELQDDLHCASGLENCVFRSEDGQRVRLQRVQKSKDGQRWEATFVFLDEANDPQRADALLLTEAQQAQHQQKQQKQHSSSSHHEDRQIPRTCGMGGGSVGSSTDRTSPSIVTRQGVEQLHSGDVVEIKDGDFFDAREDYLVHQCDCITSSSGGSSVILDRAEVLPDRLFAQHPEANVYTDRIAFDVPGDVSVHGRVVNLYAQFGPGAPPAGEPSECSYEEQLHLLAAGKEDSASDRLNWFSQCLDVLPHKLPAARPDGDRLSLAFPKGIGCGLAGGYWPAYLHEISEFARANKHLRVVVYDMG